MDRAFRSVSLMCTMTVALLCQGCGIGLYFGRAESGAQAPWAATPQSEPGTHKVAVTSTRRIIAGKGVPRSAVVMTSNNNVAVTRHQGRVWLAWRSAPNHFASSKVLLQILSSVDEKTWRFEHRISLGSDIREPEWLVVKGELFLYFSKLGKNSMAFEPQGMYAVKRDTRGQWTRPKRLRLGKMKGWRIRTVRGKPLLLAYDNGESLYRIGGDPLHVYMLTTQDGWSWVPANPDRPIIHTGGASETDFAFASDGTLYGVMRNEFGERGHYGSLVCTASPGDMTRWSCRDDPRKFDSPYVFAHGGEVYLLARRNMTPTGNFERKVFMRNIRNHLSYIVKGKRCSLWRFVDGGKRIAFVLDLPSRGDTCFPSVLKTAGDQIVVYDYSSDIHGPDSPWSVGQRKPTYIYRHELTFMN